jgi:hypothetical protein
MCLVVSVVTSVVAPAVGVATRRQGHTAAIAMEGIVVDRCSGYPVHVNTQRLNTFTHIFGSKILKFRHVMGITNFPPMNMGCLLFDVLSN